MDKLIALKEAATKAAQDAQAVAQKADDEAREMTSEEADTYRGHMAKASDLLEQAKAAKADNDLLSQVADFAKSVGAPAADGEEPGSFSTPGSRKAANLGLTVVKSSAYQGLRKAYGDRIPDGTQIHTDPIAVKSLFVGGGSGGATSAGAFVVPDYTDIVEMLGRRALTLRDVISVRRTSSDVVEYVRQTAHTNAAAIVPEATTAAAGAETVAGGYKPEGSWTFARVSTPVATIAEWVPATKRALADAAQIEDLINAELAADIAEAEENAILKGSGDITGILSTSGIQSQAFATDIFTTVRKAITKVRTIGRVVPNAVLMSPTDVETVDLARENNATGKFLGAGPWAMGPRTLWGVPILESEGIEAGTAVVGDFSKAVLWDREQTTVTLSNSHADFFVRNLVAILAEERVAFGVTRPTAFVKAKLTA